MIYAIITVSCLLFVWLIIVSSIGVIVSTLGRHIKRRGHAINVIYAQKYDLLMSLSDLMKENGIDLPNSISETLLYSNHSSLQIMNTQERLSLKTLLSNTFNTLFNIADNRGLEKSNRYITIKNSVEDIDEHYRKEVSLYNNDVNAYNYWINSFAFKLIAMIFKLRKKETML